MVACVTTFELIGTDWAIDPEKAKQMAKCIIEALMDAGLEIRVHNKP